MKNAYRLILVLLLIAGTARTANADEIVELPPFECNEDRLLPYNVLDVVYSTWYIPQIDENLIGGFNNFGSVVPTYIATPCTPFQSSLPNNPGSGVPYTKVQLFYNDIAIPGPAHAFLVLTEFDSSNNPTRRVEVRAGPLNGSGSGGFISISSSGSSFSGSGFGRIDGVVRGTGTGSDYEAYYNGAGQSIQDLFVTSTVSFDAIKAAMESYTSQVNDRSIQYNPFTANSNSFAHEAAGALAGSRPSASEWAPGSATKLICP